MSSSSMPLSVVTLEAVRAPMPVPESARSRPLMVTAEEELASSVTLTVRSPEPKRATPLNFSLVIEVSCDCNAVNSES